jgi:hypothetical protein
MVKLSDALGALLRDVAYSRMKSDIFSRDAGLEYLKDPILKLFPVPRVEIRSIEIDLAFAVTELKPEPVDVRFIALPRINVRLAELVTRVLSISVRKTRSSREFVPLNVRLGKDATRVQSGLALRLQEHLQANAESLAPLAVDQPEAFAKEISDWVIAELRSLSGLEVSPLVVSAEAKNEIHTAAADWATHLSAEIRPLVEKSKVELAVQVAVTREELTDVPQNALARVKAIVDIQNYDWVEYEDEAGTLVRKLVPR